MRQVPTRDGLAGVIDLFSCSIAVYRDHTYRASAMRYPGGRWGGAHPLVTFVDRWELSSYKAGVEGLAGLADSLALVRLGLER